MTSSTPRRRPLRRAAATAAAAALALLTLATPAVAAPPGTALAGTAARPGAPPDTVQGRLDALVTDLGAPGALLTVRDGRGRTAGRTAGVGDVATGAPVPLDGAVRVGSNTKSFVAVVLLQLVDEGEVALDDTVDDHLPGLVRGEGIDGGNITIRQLLHQSSGLPDYSDHLGDEVRHYEPRELLDLALRHPAAFRPGASWQYSNTNYLVAGMIIEEVTGRPLSEELNRRIIRPLGLRHTYLPAPGDTTIRGPHPKGYDRPAPGAPLVDVTELDPSWAWAAGGLVSTNSDLDRFFTALLEEDRLLPGDLLAEMRTTTPAEDTFGPGAEYGLGLVRRPLSCGGYYWGHGGSYPGYETRAGATADGRSAGVAVTAQVTDRAGRQRLDDLVDAALCALPDAAPGGHR
ncbi:serine hydrolase domain-containing protein [Kitasatospora sp. NPDC048194]|uniref:serine hydrolase domain-containing protein n=1 Tax=Kitasatospora sp. NPDC048194 TaxID=3364045 RepID=UPI0037162CAC